MNISSKLKEIRKNAGLTQKQLAKGLGNGGYTEFTVSAIENGKRNVDFKLCVRWAEVCKYKMLVNFEKNINEQ